MTLKLHPEAKSAIPEEQQKELRQAGLIDVEMSPSCQKITFGREPFLAICNFNVI